MDPRDTYIQIRIKRPMSQLSVLSTVDERACAPGNGITSLAAGYGSGMGHRASVPNFVPVVSLEYGLVPTSTLTPRLRGSSTSGGAATPNFCRTLDKKSSRAYRLARQLGKSRHFAGMQIGVPDHHGMGDPLKGIGMPKPQDGTVYRRNDILRNERVSQTRASCFRLDHRISSESAQNDEPKQTLSSQRRQ
ncbi:hypothetical protein RRG08_046929 [Elysia crispata]|uniref:Uncharacterized protein n=1 Tax=Elysia crispata TaxID=231223 RepID=A0AAE1DVJ2_9GAST|nr:hypothetical protein RRG08_046929 [Elysia crispata]